MKKAIGLLVLLFFHFDTCSEQVFEVKDDGERGIESKIYFGSIDNFQGDTDSSGVYISDNACDPNTYVIAQPKENYLYESGKRQCVNDQQKIAVRVTWKPVYTLLLKNKNYFESQNNFASAAMVSNEIAARTVDQDMATGFRIDAIKHFAAFLELDDTNSAVAIDPIQGVMVATPVMVKAVKSFQEKNGIQATGEINYKTLSAAADKPVSEILFKEW